MWLYGNMSCFDATAFDAYVQGGGGIVATPWVHRNFSGARNAVLWAAQQPLQ